MTDKITEPVPPAELDPLPPAPIAGDWTDDDSQVYDEEFEAADHGPVKWEGVAHPVPATKPATRLLVRTVTVGTVGGAIQQPIMLLPADVNRKKVTVSAIAAGVALASFTLGSDKGDCYNGAVFWVNQTFSTVFDLDCHTGALWAYSTVAQTVVLTVTAVTE